MIFSETKEAWEVETEGTRTVTVKRVGDSATVTTDTGREFVCTWQQDGTMLVDGHYWYHEAPPWWVADTIIELADGESHVCEGVE